MRLYGLLGGQVCIQVQSMWQSRGSPGKFCFGPFIRRNLVESGTVFTLTVYCVIKAFIIDFTC